MSDDPYIPAIIAAHRDAAARLASLPEPARAAVAELAARFAERARELEGRPFMAEAAD